VTRLSEREFTRPPDEKARERAAWTHRPDCDDENRPGVVNTITTIQDHELGFRASERLDFMEDKIDIRHWSVLAGHQR
jgi:hypothetical protein